MPRQSRLVVEGVAHHVTQRGNRGQAVFFCDEDYNRYLGWLKDYAERFGLGILGYCLMTTHVHLVGLPGKSDSLARVLHTVHMRYSQWVNFERGWSGHLWQGRYFSTALDEAHEWAAVRYVEQNPVRAGLVERAEDYRWSSAAFHLGLREDRIITREGPWGGTVEDWREALAVPQDDDTVSLLRQRTQNGFPCGDGQFISNISETLGREMILRPRGRPRSR